MILSRASILRSAALAAAVSLAGCATTGGSPVQVTRFHLDQPIAPGSFAVETGLTEGRPPALGPDSLESKSYNDIVAGEMTHLGFTPAASLTAAELVATVNVDRGTREDYRRGGGGISLGIGGASFGRHSGIGLGTGVTVPVGGNQAHYIVGTRMRVQIKRTSDGTVIWEGRAMTEAPAASDAGQPAVAVATLAHAMFMGFPGESGHTITVK
jgi:hypothetical protein